MKPYISLKRHCARNSRHSSGPGPGTPLCSSQDEPFQRCPGSPAGVPWGLRPPERWPRERNTPKPRQLHWNQGRIGNFFLPWDNSENDKVWQISRLCREKFLNKKKTLTSNRAKSKMNPVRSEIRGGQNQRGQKQRTSKIQTEAEGQDPALQENTAALARTTKAQRRAPPRPADSSGAGLSGRRQRPRSRRPPPPSGRAPRGAARSHDSP